MEFKTSPRVNECGLSGNVEVFTPPKAHFLIMIVLARCGPGIKIKTIDGCFKYSSAAITM